MKPFAITGAGLVSALGTGYSDFKNALDGALAPGEGVFTSDLEAVFGTRIKEPLAGPVTNFDARDYLGAKGLRNIDRLTRYLVVSSKLALISAGLKREDGSHVVSPERLGLCSATAYGSLDVINEMVEVVELEDPRFLSPGQFPNTVINSAAGYVSIWEDMRAPNVTIVDGNCGALDAMYTAISHLQTGRADAFVVGGGEVLSSPLYLAFRKLGLLADRGGRRLLGAPQSDGMLLGEGAGCVCVESLATAQQRGAQVLAEVVGFGTALQLPESEAMITHASGDAVARAIRAALGDAALAAEQVDLVCSSVSGVPMFDQAELDGLAQAVPHAPVVAPKAWVGETLGAGGAFAVLSAMAFLDGVRPRPLVLGAIPPEGEAGLRHVLVVATGYYGNVSALIIRRPGLES